MTEQELKRLRRSDLLELLLDLSKENEILREQLDKARQQLASRTIDIEKAGSLAEAAIKLNGVFEAAQAACDQYTMNLRQRTAEQALINARLEQEIREKRDSIEQETRAKCARLEQDTQEKCAMLEQTTRENCSRMVQDTKLRCELLMAEARQDAESFRKEADASVQEMVKSYSWLSKVLE